MKLEVEMTIKEIREMPTSIVGANKIHESVLRSYQVLKKVKYLLDEGTSANVVRELIREMENE